MSLNWNIGSIKDHKTVCTIIAEKDDEMRGVKAGDELLNPITSTLIWTTLAVDMGEITEKNAAEFYDRYVFANRVCGVTSEDVTLDDVKRHIGLSTNVSTKTAKTWGGRVFEGFHREQQWRRSRED